MKFKSKYLIAIVALMSCATIAIQDARALSVAVAFLTVMFSQWELMLKSAMDNSEKSLSLAKQLFAENELILEANQRMRREIAEMDGWESDIEHTPVPDAVQKKMREIFDDNC